MKEELSEYYVTEIEFHCEFYNKQKKEELDRQFMIFMFSIVGGIIVLILLMICYMVGMMNVIKQIFYCLTFRWVLKRIIKWRHGSEKVDKVDLEKGDTEEDLDVEDPKQKKEIDDPFKIVKLDEDRNRLRILDRDKRKCLREDKYENDEEK